MVTSSMQGLEAGSNAADKQLTEFRNEVTCTLDVRQGGMPDPQTYVDVAQVEDVKRYMARPQLLRSEDWTSSSPLKLYNIPVNLPLWTTHAHYSKVLGSYGIRATTCFKLVVAATPYHAGILRMSFSPFEGNIAHDPYTSTQYSQMPGVELNLADSTSLEFRVPFVHELNFFEVNNINSPATLGMLYLTQYTPLSIAPGADSIPYTLYWWLEDVELIGALPATIAADYTAAQARIMSIIDQSADAPSKEAEVQPAKFSAIAATGAIVAERVGRFMPTLSSVTGSTSWFLRQVAKVAASYGYSKPRRTEAVAKVFSSSNNYQINCDGFDNSYNFGATVDTQLALTRFAGTDIDEMSMSYLSSIYTRFNMVTLSKTMVRNTPLFTAPLRPSFFVDQETASVFRSTSTIAYLQNYFKFWRGTLRFRFKMAKTQFHTGRLIVGYIPNNENRTTLPSTTTAMDYKSVIWDLRKDSVLEFECPFIWNEAYREHNQDVGTIFVKVLDPLRAPDMVSSSVPIVVEVAGGDDLEFAVPTRVRRPFAYVAPTFSELPVDQSVEFKQLEAPYCEQCIGNRILSLKSLLSRSARCYLNTDNNSVAFDYPNLCMGGTAYYHDYLILPFTLYRGGWRFSLINKNPAAMVGASWSPSDAAMLTSTDPDPVLYERYSVHATVPYHHVRSRRIITSGGSSSPVQLFTTAGAPLKDNAALYCSFGEDFQLGYFRCTPLMAS